MAADFSFSDDIEIQKLNAKVVSEAHAVDYFRAFSCLYGCDLRWMADLQWL